ncbi:hypothetical protein C8Q79DRAFT_921702, partial [Trametes meyenii]
ITRPSSTSSTALAFHCYYATAIQCASGDSIPAELRVYSPPNDTPLPDDTIVFLVAKLHLRPNDSALLDAVQLFPVPGNPSSETYQDNVPDMPYPNIYAIGVVQGKHEVLADGKSRGFTLNVSERVHDTAKDSILQCVLSVSCPTLTVY